MFKERTEERRKIRTDIARGKVAGSAETFLLISESLDDYLEQRIETDKVLVGILKDIQGNIASIAELNRSVLAEGLN